jgi:hypothetical protein
LSETSESTSQESVPDTAFLFEFDHLVVGLREASFDVLKSIYDDVDLQPVHYSRFGLTEGPHKTIDQLQSGLSVRKGQPKKVSEELVSGIKMHLESGSIMVSDELRDVVVQARELNMQVLAMTALPIQPREALSAALDLSGLGIELVPFGTDLEPAPRADSWLKLIKEEGINGPGSISLTTSMQSAKSSLTASIPTVVYPDRFTSFQDFGGARAVVDSLKDINLKQLLEYGIALA